MFCVCLFSVESDCGSENERNNSLVNFKVDSANDFAMTENNLNSFAEDINHIAGTSTAVRKNDPTIVNEFDRYIIQIPNLCTDESIDFRKYIIDRSKAQSSDTSQHHEACPSTSGFKYRQLIKTNGGLPRNMAHSHLMSMHVNCPQNPNSLDTCTKKQLESFSQLRDNYMESDIAIHFNADNDIESGDAIHVNVNNDIESDAAIHVNVDNDIESNDAIHVNVDNDIESDDAIHVNVNNDIESDDAIHVNVNGLANTTEESINTREETLIVDHGCKLSSSQLSAHDDNTAAGFDDKKVKLLDHTTVNKSLDHSTANAELDHTTVNKSLDHSTVNTELDHTTVNKSLDHSTVNTELDHSTANTELDHSTANTELDHTRVNGQSLYTKLDWLTNVTFENDPRLSRKTKIARQKQAVLSTLLKSRRTLEKHTHDKDCFIEVFVTCPEKDAGPKRIRIRVEKEDISSGKAMGFLAKLEVSATVQKVPRRLGNENSKRKPRFYSCSNLVKDDKRRRRCVQKPGRLLY